MDEEINFNDENQLTETMNEHGIKKVNMGVPVWVILWNLVKLQAIGFGLFMEIKLLIELF